MTSPSAQWQLASCVLGLPSHDAEGVPATQAGPAFWQQQLADVAAEGFDAVELSDAWVRITDLTSAQRSELRAIAASSGLVVPAVHIQRASVIDPEDAEANLAYHHASIEATAEMGAGVYSTGLHYPFNEAQRRALWFWTAQGPKDPESAEIRALAVARIRELADHAAQVGLLVSLELYEDTYLGTAESAVRFVEEVGRDNVGLNPDVGNLIRLHRPIESWIELYERTLPYANYWHVKNYLRDEAADGSSVFATPSTLRDGIINYRQILEIAERVGYRGTITCEHYGGDSLSICGENRRYLTHIISRLQSRAVSPALTEGIVTP